MHTIKALFIVLFACLLTWPLPGQEKEMPPAGGQPKDFKLPARDEFTLDNGLKVVMIEYGILPQATVNLAIRTGSILEGENENGLFPLLVKLMEEGTEQRSAKELSAAFARMGGELNISSGTHISSIATTVLSEFAPESVRLIAEVAQRPAFPAGELDRLKNDLKRQYSVQRSQPQTQANEAFFRQLYGDHPYGRPLPPDEAVDRYTAGQVRAFYDRNFGARRSTLYVVGRFSKAAVRQAIEEAFGGWAPGTEADFPVAEANASQETILLDRPNSPQSTLYFGIPVPDPSHPDYSALDVMDDLLGGSFGSRITSNIREDKGYTYSPFSTVANLYQTAIWYEQADVTIEHTGDALLEIAREIDRLRKEVPSEEELDGIKNYKAGQFVLQNSSPTGIINQLLFMDLHGLSDDYLNQRVQNIHAVTPEQVRSMVDKYLDPEKMVLVVVGDKKQTEPQIEAFEKADKSFKKVLD